MNTIRLLNKLSAAKDHAIKEPIKVYGWILLTLLLWLTACNRNTFPSGTWEMDSNQMLGTMIFVYTLNSDSTGTVIVNPPALAMSAPGQTTLSWRYDGSILTMKSTAPITIGGSSNNFQDTMTLLGQTDTTITWKDGDGHIVEWKKLNK